MKRPWENFARRPAPMTTALIALFASRSPTSISRCRRELIAQHPAAERSASRLLDGSGEPRRSIGASATCPTCCAAATCWSSTTPAVIKARLLGGKASGGAVEALVERVERRRRGRRPAAREQVAAGRQHDPLRRRLRCRGARPRRGRRLALRAALPGRSAGPARAPRPRAAAALHRARRRRRRRARATRRCSPNGRARSPRRPRRCTSTPALLAALAARGVERCAVTLHVGAGTFQPVRSENLAEHVMHSERYEVGADAVDAIERTRARGGRVVAVGTTSLRALESAALARRPSARRSRRSAARPISSSRRASRFASSTCCSPTSTCRRARC